MKTSTNSFEALLYSAEPALAERYARSFDAFPANWISFNEPEVAREFLGKEHFDFIVLDVECEHGRAMLQQLCESGAARQSVIFAVTSGVVDAATLALCYESGVVYPVRPTEIRAHLQRSVAVAERLAQQRAAAVPETEPITSEEEVKATIPEVVQEVIHTSKTFAGLLGMVARSMLGRKHALGVTAQEWVASLLSGVATIWFVEESTANFRGLLNVAPPSAGPSYLLALSVLLWLCAKQRRGSNKDVVRRAVRQ